VEEITLGHFDVAGAETLKHKGLQDVVFLLLDYKHLKYWSGFDIMLRHKPMVEQFVEEFYSDTKNISKTVVITAGTIFVESGGRMTIHQGEMGMYR